MTVIPNALDGERVDRVVSMLCDLTRKEAADLVAAGGVRLEGRPVTLRSRRVAEGETLDVEMPPPGRRRRPSWSPIPASRCPSCSPTTR